jgi:vancomycin resistance protein YoaR
MRTDIAKKFATGAGFAFGLYLIIVILQPILFTDRFGMDSFVAGINVSYQTSGAVKTILSNKFAEYQKGKIAIGGDTVNGSDYLSSVDVDKTVNEALLSEQSGYLGLSKLMKQSHEPNVTVNEDNISKLLITDYYKTAVTPVDANIVVSGKTAKVVPETDGQRLMVAESRQRIIDGVSNLLTEINLDVEPQMPMVMAAEAELAASRAEEVVSKPVTLLGDGVSYTISTADLQSWLKITPTTPKTLMAVENFIPQNSEYDYLDPSKILLYINTLATSIDKPAVNAQLAVVNGAVVVSEKEQVGQSVDRKDAINQIEAAVVGNRTAKLTIDTVQPDIRTDNLASLGLTELVSTGWTDFSGSPSNRLHNIQVGAARFNGVLIKPGEDFSFDNALGNVDASTGYLPELVILANKTVPEYGGGLCQVSTTAFRAALNAGLPILERYPHAYPVSYYKPYGVDATIYLPSPDLRFSNDTGKYILIQTRIVGNKLYFDFYGTKKPGTIKFSGNANATGAVDTVEQVTPTISEQGLRGPNSFTAVIYRHIYDVNGKMIDDDKFTSQYDSPNNYPH